MTLVSPDGRYGGPVEVARQLAGASAREGHEVAVAAGRSGYRGRGPRREGGVSLRLFRVFGGRARHRFSRLVSPGLWLWLWRTARDADVVHVHLSRDLIMAVAALVLLRRRRGGRPAIVVQTHGMIVPSASPLARIVDAVATRPVLRMAHAVFCLDEKEAELVRRVEPAARTSLLANGIQLAPVPPEPARREVLFLARLHARKKPVDFVRMAARLAPRWPDVRFTLVGPDGGEGDAVHAAIAAAGSDSIVWEGAVPPSGVHERLAAASVYVLPAADEPFGMTVVEAMACARPVVIAASGGLAERVSAEAAGVVFDDTLDGLVEAVEGVLRDADAARSMGARARRLVEAAYSIDVVAAEAHRVYGEALGSAGSRILWVTNVAAPYRIPVWRELARRHPLDVVLLEDDDRLSADAAANRGADWRADRTTDLSLTSVPTARVSRGEGRYYLLRGIPRVDHDAVLLGGWESPAYWQYWLVARLRRRRIVGFYESLPRTQQHTRGLIAIARRLWFRSLDAVVVPGVAARAGLEQMGVRSDRIFTGFNAVDVHGFRRDAHAVEEAPASAGHRYVYVGRLLRLKGVDLAVAAFAAARRTGDVLTIVGVGEEEAALRAQAADLAIQDAVVFAGFVENADLPAILGGQHTLVMPSRQDVWGLVANEALAAGLHVVVSDAAGVSESIEGMRGVFPAPPEVAALAEQLRRSAAAWAGRIEQPEILVHDPAAFARVFSRALAPGDDDDDGRSAGG